MPSSVKRIIINIKSGQSEIEFEDTIENPINPKEIQNAMSTLRVSYVRRNSERYRSKQREKVVSRETENPNASVNSERT